MSKFYKEYSIWDYTHSLRAIIRVDGENIFHGIRGTVVAASPSSGYTVGEKTTAMPMYGYTYEEISEEEVMVYVMGELK